MLHQLSISISISVYCGVLCGELRREFLNGVVLRMCQCVTNGWTMNAALKKYRKERKRKCSFFFFFYYIWNEKHQFVVVCSSVGIPIPQGETTQT